MNKNHYRLVFSRVRGMLVAVEETASRTGKTNTGETRRVAERGGEHHPAAKFALRVTAFGALVAAGMNPIWATAQIVGGGAHAPAVVQTPNGLPQVNINKPSAGGVSLNTYNQFDVQKSGAILNNASTIVNTQQAGYINGNPNLSAGQAARIIVNQVNSTAASQIRGYVEIAGSRAEIVLANPAGIVVDGGGFINTSRAVLTTGVPQFGADGSLTGFNVNRGLVTVQGAGLDTSNVDQTDIIARAVQANAAIYAKNLNVIAGANQVNHDTLATTPIAGDGPAPAVAIDVAQLGGMYANRVFLVGNSSGVGVANAGTIAAQAGDLTLQSDGRLVLTGKTTASGNLAMSASGGIQNSGTTYAQQSLSANSAADFANSGTLAAQQNAAINAGSVNSTGTLGAGVNNDGSVAHSGDLNLIVSGQLTAIGQNVAGGNASLTSGSVNLAGSQTAANGNLSLNATAGDVNLSNATTSAQGAIQANASGTVINDHGSLSSGNGTTLTGGNLSNQGGKISSQGALSVNVAGQIANQSGELVSERTVDVRGGAIANNQGTVQSAAGMTVASASLDNTAGRMTSLNSDGLSVTTSGQLTNAAGTTANGAQGGVIGGNGDVTVHGGNVANHGTMTSNTNLHVSGRAIDNSSGALQATQTVAVDAGAHLINNGGSIVAQTAELTGTALDNSAGVVKADKMSLNATDLVNHGGTITQIGTGAMSVNVSGTLDNSNGGTLQTNSTDLTLAPASLVNDGGKITHAGTGTLTLGNGTGSVSNVGGTIASNGRVVERSAKLNNTSGSITGQTGLSATVGSVLNNTNGKLLSNTDLGITSGTLANDGGRIGATTNAVIHTGSMTNLSGSVSASNVSVTADSTLDNNGGKLEANQLALTTPNLTNHGGTITQYGSSAMAVNVSGTLDNSAAGVIQTNSTDLMLTPASLVNDGGTITHAGTGTLAIGNGAGSMSNVGGSIVSNGRVITQSGSLNNTSGAINGQAGVTATIAGVLNNTNGKLLSSTDLAVSSGTLTNDRGQLGASANAMIHTGSMSNLNGSIVAPNLSVMADSTLDNNDGSLEANQLALSASNLTNHGGTITQLGSSAMAVNVSGTLDNSNGGTLQTNSTDLTLSPASLVNDGGTITHVGSGMLTLGNATGSVSNVGGSIASNGRVVEHSATLNNTSGLINGKSGVTATVGNVLNNTNGKLQSRADLGVFSGTLTNDGGQIGASTNASIHTGSMTNQSGSVSASSLSVTAGSTIDNSRGKLEANQLALTAPNLTNHGGTITQYGSSAMAVNVSGSLDNSAAGVIQTNSTDLTLAASQLNNAAGTITHAGTGTLTIEPGNGASALNNAGGTIVTKGQAVVDASSWDNSNGILAAQGGVTATVAGDVNNAQGLVRAGASLSLTNGGALVNQAGHVQAGQATAGDTSTLAVHSGSVNNADGAITDLGTGAMTVQSGSQVTNSRAGNVSGMGAITGNGDVTISATSISNTQGGELSGASLHVQGTTLDNSGGQIGSVANSSGDVDVTTSAALTNTNGHISATHDLAITAPTLQGGGAYSAAHDVRVNLQGDYTTTPGTQFNVGNDLTFALPGTFTNNAGFQTINGLNINAANIVNSGALSAGGLLHTQSSNLSNTGSLVGGSVSLNATGTVSNVGPTALIGASDSNGKLEILAHDIENRDDTTATDSMPTTAIFGMGKVVLAGGKDASGNYTNAALVNNSSALIQSGSDMELHADKVTSTRRVMSTTGSTSNVDPAVLAQYGISLSGCAAYFAGNCTGQTSYGIRSDNLTPDMAGVLIKQPGGMYIEPPHGGQWNSSYQYTTYTGTAVANTVTALSPAAQIVSGGKIDASSTGTLQNYWSSITAVGNLHLPQNYDGNGWAATGQQAPTVTVTYSGQYHYNNYDNSEHNWQLPFGDATFVTSRPGGYTQVAPADVKTYKLPGYDSTLGSNGTISGTGVSINNTAGNASLPSLGLLPGQSVTGLTPVSLNGAATGSGATVTPATLNGNATASATAGGAVRGAIAGAGAQSAAPVHGGASTPVDRIIASATALNVLNNLTIPQGGLYRPNPSPNANYVIETNPAFTNQKNFISSDYFFGQIGVDLTHIPKRLGDGFYEQQLVRNQVTALTGRAVLGPYADLQAMYQQLMAAGAALDKQLNLPIGASLSPEQVSKLTGNVIMMETRVVDGQSVLVPVVYLAQANQQNVNGPLITATDIDLKDAQNFTNSGTLKADNSLSIQGKQIDNAFGALQSGGLMSLKTDGNVDLTSAKVKAGSLNLNAGGDLILDTAVKTDTQVSRDGATSVKTTLGPIAYLDVKGDAAIITGGNLEQHAGALTIGGNLGLLVGGNYDLGTQQVGEHKIVQRANGVSNTDINGVVASTVNVGGVSMIGVNGDLTATGAQINLGNGGTIAAKGNVTLGAASTASTVDSNSSGSDHHGSYSETLHTSDQAVVGAAVHSGNTVNVASGKDINVIGSTISLDQGNVGLMAVGNVNVGAVTETHVSNMDESHDHGGVASHASATNRVDQTTTYANGSTISADGVTVVSGKDINVTGSSIVGTHDVALSAKGNVNITAATNTYQDNEYHQEKHSGLSGSGGLGITIGSSEKSDRYNATSTTQSQSRSSVGSVEGNVKVSAGKDVHIGGSDVVAGKAVGDVKGATGNISIAGENVTIDTGQDRAQSHDQQEAHSSGLTVAVTGTPFDTARNLKADASSGNGFQRGQSVLTEIGASAADVPSISVTYGRSRSSSTTDMWSLTNAGSTVRGGGNVTVKATGGAQKDANGNAVDGDIAVIGSAISAGGTATLDANRNVTLQASTDELRQNTSSSSSSTSLALLSTPSLGDVARWIGGTANSGGNSPSPYNASQSNSDGSQTMTQQTASSVTGNSVVIKSKTGDINVVGSGISGTQGVDLVATQGAINVLAGLDTNVTHQESSSHQVGSLGSNGTATGFSVGVANSHSVQDTSSQTQSTMRSQIVSGNGNVTLDAKQDITVAGSDLSSGKDLTLIGKNLNLDPGTDATQSRMSQDSSQFGVSVALGGAVGNAIAQANQAFAQPARGGDSRLAALDKAQAGLAAYNAYQVGSALSDGKPTNQALVKATVSIGGGTSHSEAQSSSVANDGSTLHAGGKATLIATGSGAKDAKGFATDGDINASGTQITAQNVDLSAARDINLTSAKDTSQQSSSNSSSGGSIGVGAAIGGQQNGFTLELGASTAHGHANGNSITNRDTQITAGNALSITSGRDTNLRGAEVSGNTVNASVGRDLNIASQQDTSTYDSKQSSAGFQASICVPPFCYGQTVSGSASASQQNINANYQSVNQQSGIYAGTGGYNVNVGNHTQLDGGVIASTATPDKNSLSTQTLGFTNLENHASYSGDTVGFSASGGFGNSTPGGVNLNTPVKQGPNNVPGAQNSQGLGPSGFSAAGTSSDASGTTYAAVAPGTVTVRGDAGTGHDSTAGLSRDTANANGAVQNTFNAQNVQNDMAVQQSVGQVGMQVVGDVANALQNKAIADETKARLAYANASAAGDTAGMAQAQADFTAAQQQEALWGNDGAARIASHAGIAAIGAALGGGNVAGAVAGTVAGDMAGNAVGNALGDTLGGTLLANAASGLAGAAAGGALGGSAGAMSGANGALSADLFNRQLHPQERTMISTVAKGIAAANGKTPADQAKLADYWTNMLTLAAGAKVDAQAQTQLTQYEIQLVQAAQASGNSQALDTFMQNLKIAQNAINQMSGYTISGTTGAIVADGSTVKTFQSTSAQFNDSTLFGTPGGTAHALASGQTPQTAGIGSQYYVDPNGPTNQQVAGFAQDQIAKAGTSRDAIAPEHTAEDFIIATMGGGLATGAVKAIAGRVAAAVSDVVSKSIADVPKPVTSGGTANAATAEPLAIDLAKAQSVDPLIGKTLPGASAPVKVTADASIGGQSFYDVNQTARGVGFGDPNQPTLISKLVAPGDPNGVYGEAHAEIGVIQQAYNAGLTQGQSMTIVVRGLSPCSYCSGDLMDMAQAAGLSELTVVDGVTGAVNKWIPGGKDWIAIDPKKLK
ncbi:hemagglutinin repeat-containing protein [Burkholderia sp. AU39826]|uniref:hemagglutinin repeat-containing protein n=1 Tax=Burkholderia sp. AU39826 TaxID=2879634 RepID=UPI00299E5BD2|nr:hemagglutinin repeat-containing protein [Burkholderia sp. AU39826]